MRHSVPRAVLSVAYVLYCGIGALAIIGGRTSILTAFIFAFAVITLLSLNGQLGRWAQIAGLFFGAVLSLSGLICVAIGVLAEISGEADALQLALLGLVFLAVGVPTIVSLRSDMNSASVVA